MGNEVLGSLQWEDEHGDLIEAHLNGIYLAFELMSQDASGATLAKTFCLKFIDPYGDTTFNQLQIPVLIEELKSLLPSYPKGKKRQEIEAMISFIEKAKDKVHTYIKFYGD
jgi:hypothetical protein